MAALKLDMTIPLGSTGHLRFAADVTDLTELTQDQRQALAATATDFAEFAANVIIAAAVMTATDLGPGHAATVHDPNGSVLAGVTGTRRNTS